MRKKSKSLKRIISLVLTVVMMVSIGTSVMAEDYSGYVTTEFVTEYLDNDVTLVKELAVKMPKERWGFSGTRYAIVTHRLFKQGVLQAEIRAEATFASTLASDTCYIQNASYTKVKEGSYPFYLYDILKETRESMQGAAPEYAQYSVQYCLSGFQNIYKTMYIKCDSNGITSNNSEDY